MTGLAVEVVVEVVVEAVARSSAVCCQPASFAPPTISAVPVHVKENAVQKPVGDSAVREAQMRLKAPRGLFFVLVDIAVFPLHGGEDVSTNLRCCLGPI